jgi:peptidyl-tRNA hydrolase
MQTKQVIVIQRGLKMRRGKEISQGCHAAMSFLTKRGSIYQADLESHPAFHNDYLSKK